jgi:plastocyanin
MQLRGVALGWAIAVAAATAADAASGVNVQLFQFRPGAIAVKSGERVTWTNQDDIEHTVTAGVPDRPDGRFDFTLSGKGTMASAEFPTPDTYAYFCKRHQHMRGEVKVN